MFPGTSGMLRVILLRHQSFCVRTCISGGGGSAKRNHAPKGIQRDLISQLPACFRRFAERSDAGQYAFVAGGVSARF